MALIFINFACFFWFDGLTGKLVNQTGLTIKSRPLTSLSKWTNYVLACGLRNAAYNDNDKDGGSAKTCFAYFIIGHT
jgi:hypothetical protein